MDSLRKFRPMPEHITEVAARCADAVTAFGRSPRLAWCKKLGNSGVENDPMPDHIDIPDDLSDL